MGEATLAQITAYRSPSPAQAGTAMVALTSALPPGRRSSLVRFRRIQEVSSLPAGGGAKVKRWFLMAAPPACSVMCRVFAEKLKTFRALVKVVPGLTWSSM
ncbi:hypothetical protein ACWEN6_37995 [Sphaerisporangium sp. NPDC004334]